MARILFLLSSARTIALADGSSCETGFFSEGLLKPYDRLTAAGAEIAISTVDGKPPHPDPYSLERVFHYDDDDRGFLASVTRTFKPQINDIRVTLQQLAELD